MILTGAPGVPAGNAEKLIIPTIKRIAAREYAILSSFFELIINPLQYKKGSRVVEVSDMVSGFK